MARLPPSPELDWSDSGVPRARAFGDGYFSAGGGLAEAEAVFLRGVGLPEAWSRRDRFAICELGFGSALNVLAAWRGWRATRPPHAVLHICSIEAYPLARADAARALKQFSEIADLAARLLARWPVRTYAPQRLWFEEDAFALTLFTGEAETLLSGMSGCFDAWFLDGFAPSRNPTMWTDEVLRQVARLSAPGARLASFSVAGDVRRGLQAAGFAVERKPGFGAKRERLEARLLEKPDTSPAPVSQSIYPYGAAHPKRVAILGAGIAGAACAQALTRRGIETIVLEGAGALGAGASGNPAGLVMPRLDRAGALSELFLAAYLQAIAQYEAMGGDVFTGCGIEQRPTEGGQAAHADLLNNPPLPQDWLTSLPGGGALHRHGGVLRPLEVLKRMLAQAQLQFEAQVQSLDRSDEAWILRAPDGRAMLKADAVVLACGAALTRFDPASFLPIALSRGQIEWGEGQPPARALVRSSYAAPFGGGVLFGATFDQVDEAAEIAPSADARARNLAALAELSPEIAASVRTSTLRSRASVRATTPDRAPIAGLLPDAQAWLSQYADVAQGRRASRGASPPAHAGIYVIGGMGARGLTLAPLLGERIAAEMCGEPLPLSQFALDAIHPARFLHRALKRR